MGTAKAGKSTFINALLGREYLPSDTSPETVGVVLVQGSADPLHAQGSLFVFDPANGDGGQGQLLARGQAAIRDTLRKVNRLQRAAAEKAAEAAASAEAVACTTGAGRVEWWGHCGRVIGGGGMSAKGERSREDDPFWEVFCLVECGQEWVGGVVAYLHLFCFRFLVARPPPLAPGGPWIVD
jgi:hypothetical protein